MVSLPTIDEQFYSHLTAEDELGVVVRAHIHIEASIIDFVRARVPFPDDLPRLQYEARLRLAIALGLKPQYFESLKLFGDIRNTFGHNLDATLAETRINELFSKLPKEAQEITLKAYVMIVEQRGGKDTLRFAQLSPRDRFILMSVTLKNYIVAAAHEAASKNGP